MQYKTFKILVNDDYDNLEDLNKFLKSYKIITIRKEFVSNQFESYWAFLIEYISSRNDSKPKQQIDYKNVLNATDFAIFSKLREFRKTLSEEEGVPVYAICTNEQLSEIAKNKITTIEGLNSIQGIGKSKIDKYGAKIIEYMSRLIKNN